jgi:two-component system C4-dicarboxylate transport response regulator DctD
MALQVKLLRVLQERRLERLGGNESIPVSFRVIAASKADLLQLSAQGQFREDLYYRIGVATIDLPRLCERRDDIPLLLAHFTQDAARRYGRAEPQWTETQMAQWQAADWPGNLRELRNFAERLVLGIVPPAPVQALPALSLPLQVDALERDLIIRALDRVDGNVASAADHLGVPRKTLYDKLKKYQLAPGKK